MAPLGGGCRPACCWRPVQRLKSWPLQSLSPLSKSSGETITRYTGRDFVQQPSMLLQAQILVSILHGWMVDRDLCRQVMPPHRQQLQTSEFQLGELNCERRLRKAG
mmetsp:Transcript_57527/g.130028  ORF Transcript_57527/g.130028 Transcript_57527/m.130028 type:complete len:106 (+) Transcript_57527:322-639(+)